MTKNKISTDFCIYGDSIAYGYGNNNISWFDLLKQNKNISGSKLAQNGDKISDVLNKFSKDASNYNCLFFAIGINDLLQNSNNSKNFDNTNSLSQYDLILSLASSRTKTLIIQSLLPVRETLFPNQNWLIHPQWIFNKNIVDFNKELQILSQKYEAIYINAYSKFENQFLDNLYIDAAHLNKEGQILLLDIYSNTLKDIK